jgi:predicted amidohydrolase
MNIALIQMAVAVGDKTANYNKVKQLIHEIEGVSFGFAICYDIRL